MGVTKVKLKQLENSVTAGSIPTTDGSNILTYVAPSSGVNHLWGYETGGSGTLPILIGTNLSYDAVTNTLNASAGAGGYSDVQEDGAGFANSNTNTKLNFTGTGLTASDGGSGVTTVALNSFLNTLASAGTILLSSGNVSGTLPVGSGGTGQSSYAVGDILYASTTSALSKLSDIATGNALISGGVGVAPSYGKIGLTTHVSGTLPIGNGGTGTTTGSITGSGALTFTAGGTNTNIVLAPNGTGSVDVSSKKITNLADPTAAQDAATKNYVDSQIQGLNPKGKVRVATTVAGTLATSFANGQTVDTIVLATNDRILIKNQAAPAENGIYIVNASGAPTRAIDMDAWSEVISAYVLVEVGSTQADTGWLCTSDSGGTLGTTAINWVQFSSAGIITASNGLTKTANNIELKGSLSSSEVIDGTTTGFLTFTSARNSAAQWTLAVNNTSASGHALKASTISGTGVALYGETSNGTAVYGSAGGGFGLGAYVTGTNGTAKLQVDNSGTSTVVTNLVLDRNVSGGVGANGVGQTILFTGETSTLSGINQSTIVSKWSNATHASRLSEFSITGYNIGTENTLITLLGTGKATLNKYGVGSFTSGTPVYTLQVDASGNIMEGSLTSSVTVTRAYKTSFTGTVITLNSGTDVTDKAGSNIAFSTAGLSADQIVVVKNGIVLSESGTPARDYTLNTTTSVLTLAEAAVSDDQFLIYKIV